MVAHTYDPILEIFARLNAIRQNKEGGEDFIARNIQALVKMAHKDRYAAYRDIIYYTAAQMELERKNEPGAVSFLHLSIKFSDRNGPMRNKAFLQLGNLSFADKNYRMAKSSYDSLNLISLASEGDVSWLPDRKSTLATIVAQMDVLARQDSLQRIAAMPPAQRDALLKKMAKYLRKLQGLRDEEEADGGNSFSNNQNNQIPDLFSSGAGAGAADWYFNNPNLKAKGYTTFKIQWGNRPNVDNWQVSSIMKNSLQAAAGSKNSPDALGPDGQAKGAASRRHRL